jgi:hypothetical protein
MNMLAFIVLCGLAIYAFNSFRRAIGESPEAAARRVIAQAEALTGYTHPHKRWIRPAVATIACWVGIMVTMTPAGPAIAVWVGGAVIAVGAAAVFFTLPDPTRVDPDQLDLELRALLERS